MSAITKKSERDCQNSSACQINARSFPQPERTSPNRRHQPLIEWHGCRKSLSALMCLLESCRASRCGDLRNLAMELLTFGWITVFSLCRLDQLGLLLVRLFSSALLV